GQRRRPPQAPDHGPRGGGGDHRRQARFRAMGADLLRRVRWAAEKARPGEDHRRVMMRAVCRILLFCTLVAGCSREPASSPAVYTDPALSVAEPAQDEFGRQREQMVKGVEEVFRYRPILWAMRRVP